MIYGIMFVLSGILAYIGSVTSRIIALRFGIVDHPHTDLARKKHRIPMPLMGATGFVLVACLVSSMFWLFAKYDIGGQQAYLYQGLYQRVGYFWVIVATMLLVLAGYLDDSGKIGIIGRFALTGIALGVTVLLGGLGIEALSYPFDTILPQFNYLPQALAFLWIGFCLFTTKVLDGHDGLVSSVGVVGFLTIASVATFANVNQPLVVVLSLIWASSILGFLPLNFPHARLYLGDGGSMIIGYMIGVLSILSGAKIATAGSAIGWFVIDLLFVWFRRVLDGRNPLTSSDRFHWHQRLADSGLTKIQVLALTMVVVLTTSRIGLMVRTENKLYVLIAQGVVLLGIFGITYGLSHWKLKKIHLCNKKKNLIS